MALGWPSFMLLLACVKRRIGARIGSRNCTFFARYRHVPVITESAPVLIRNPCIANDTRDGSLTKSGMTDSIRHYRATLLRCAVSFEK